MTSFYLEISLSLLALMSIRLIAIGHHLGGIVGVICQTFWISYWIWSNQYGFLLIDAGLLVIYFDYIRTQCSKNK